LISNNSYQISNIRDGGLDGGCGVRRDGAPSLRAARSNPSPVPPSNPTSYVPRPGAPSLRSTGTLAICRALQVRSNPVPGGKHTYVTLPALDCRAPIRPTYRKCGGARNDGQGKPCPAHGAGEPYQLFALPLVKNPAPRTARGNHPAASRHPSQEGNLRGRAGLKPAPT
jgi:hypothetical protein